MKKGLFIVLVVFILTALFSLSCSSGSTTPTTTFTTTSSISATTTTTTSTLPTTTTTSTSTITSTTSTTTTTTTPQNAMVTIKDFAYSPATLTISVGTTVVWENQDSVPHTVTSDTGLFDSGTLSNGGTFSFTFTSPGTFNYGCTIHPYMHGTIIVQ
jgi:plastocyanin